LMFQTLKRTGVVAVEAMNAAKPVNTSAT